MGSHVLDISSEVFDDLLFGIVFNVHNTEWPSASLHVQELWSWPQLTNLVARLPEHTSHRTTKLHFFVAPHTPRTIPASQRNRGICRDIERDVVWQSTLTRGPLATRWRSFTSILRSVQSTTSLLTKSRSTLGGTEHKVKSGRLHVHIGFHPTTPERH